MHGCSVARVFLFDHDAPNFPELYGIRSRERAQDASANAKPVQLPVSARTRLRHRRVIDQSFALAGDPRARAGTRLVHLRHRLATRE